MTEVGFDLRIEFNLTIKGNAPMSLTFKSNVPEIRIYDVNDIYEFH